MCVCGYTGTGLGREGMCGDRERFMKVGKQEETGKKKTIS